MRERTPTSGFGALLVILIVAAAVYLVLNHVADQSMMLRSFSPLE